MDNKRERIAYLTGYIEGVTQFAVWKNGEQLVGILGTPVQRVIGPQVEELRALQKEVLP